MPVLPNACVVAFGRCAVCPSRRIVEGPDQCDGSLPDTVSRVAIFRADGVYIHGPNTRYDKVLDGSFHGIYTFWIAWKDLPLLRGRYRLSMAVFDKNHLKPHVWHNQLHDFEVVSELEDHGTVLLDHGWGLITHVEGDKADVAPLPISEPDTA